MAVRDITDRVKQLSKKAEREALVVHEDLIHQSLGIFMEMLSRGLFSAAKMIRFGCVEKLKDLGSSYMWSTRWIEDFPTHPDWKIQFSIGVSIRKKSKIIT